MAATEQIERRRVTGLLRRGPEVPAATLVSAQDSRSPGHSGASSARWHGLTQADTGPGAGGGGELPEPRGEPWSPDVPPGLAGVGTPCVVLALATGPRLITIRARAVSFPPESARGQFFCKGYFAVSLWKFLIHR